MSGVGPVFVFFFLVLNREPPAGEMQGLQESLVTAGEAAFGFISSYYWSVL